MPSSGQLILKSDGKIALDPTTGKVQIFDTGVCACCDSIDCNGCATSPTMTLIVANVQTNEPGTPGFFVWSDIAWNGTYTLTYGTFIYDTAGSTFTAWYYYMGVMRVVSGQSYNVWYVATCGLDGFGNQVMNFAWAYHPVVTLTPILFASIDGPGGVGGPSAAYSVVRTCGAGTVLFPHRGTTGAYQCPPSTGGMGCGDAQLVIP